MSTTTILYCLLLLFTLHYYLLCVAHLHYCPLGCMSFSTFVPLGGLFVYPLLSLLFSF